jgi:hypothetical protein
MKTMTHRRERACQIPLEESGRYMYKYIQQIQSQEQGKT